MLPGLDINTINQQWWEDWSRPGLDSGLDDWMKAFLTDNLFIEAQNVVNTYHLLLTTYKPYRCHIGYYEGRDARARAMYTAIALSKATKEIING